MSALFYVASLNIIYFSKWKIANSTPQLSTSLGTIISNCQLKADPIKTHAVTERQTPNTCQTTVFLGFANFYRWFIRNYSVIAAQLTKLTSTDLSFN